MMNVRRSAARVAATGGIVAAVAATLLWGAGGGAAVLADDELAALRGGRAPTTYCNPHTSCSGTVVYCSDCTPGANAGDLCDPSTVTTFYNPEHCTDTPNGSQCGTTTSVFVYCKTVSQCVTAFSGTTKYCTESGSISFGQTLTTDQSRCRNLFAMPFQPPPP